MSKNKISVVLSGGSIKGAFSVGVVNALMELVSFERLEIVAGTSVGSLVGAMLSQNRLKELNQIWDGLRSPKDMMRKWAYGIPVLSQFVGYLKGGLYDFSPTEKMIDASITPDLLSSPVKFYSCSVDLVTGDKIYACNHTADSLKSMKRFIAASSSMAPAFRPIKIFNRWLTDGGCKEPIPARVVAENAKESELIVVILTRPIKSRNTIEAGGTLLDVAKRNVDFLFDEVFDNDIRVGIENYWKGKRYVVIAPDHVVFKDSFDVTAENIKRAKSDGYRIGKSLLSVLDL